MVFKMLSSTAFLGVTFLSASTEWSEYRRLITTSLVFAFLGDFFLVPSRSEFYGLDRGIRTSQKLKPQGVVSISFQLGIVAFAVAHIAYTIAFVQDCKQVSRISFIVTFLGTLAIAKWLGVIYPTPHSSFKTNAMDLYIDPDMTLLVFAYAVIISIMFAAAISTTSLVNATNWSQSRKMGAAMFVMSDLFVAKNAFGKHSVPESRGWPRIFLGYALYFWGQMIIAGTARAR